MLWHRCSVSVVTQVDLHLVMLQHYYLCCDTSATPVCWHECSTGVVRLVFSPVLWHQSIITCALTPVQYWCCETSVFTCLVTPEYHYLFCDTGTTPVLWHQCSTGVVKPVFLPTLWYLSIITCPVTPVQHLCCDTSAALVVWNQCFHPPCDTRVSLPVLWHQCNTCVLTPVQYWCCETSVFTHLVIPECHYLCCDTRTTPVLWCQSSAGVVKSVYLPLLWYQSIITCVVTPEQHQCHETSVFTWHSNTPEYDYLFWHQCDTSVVTPEYLHVFTSVVAPVQYQLPHQRIYLSCEMTVLLTCNVTPVQHWCRNTSVSTCLVKREYYYL